jgi:hypothetical protein
MSNFCPDQGRTRVYGEAYSLYAAAENPRRTQIRAKRAIYGWKLIKHVSWTTSRSVVKSMIPFDLNIFPQVQGTFITGGSIRDILLGRVPTDYDITVTGDPKEFAEKMAASASGHIVEIGKPGQSIIRVLTADHIFDITSLSGIKRI